MTKQSDLVPLPLHNLLTTGPAPWTATRVPSEVWHVTRAVYGTSNEDDEKRAYRTVQAALWKAGITTASGQAEPQPEREPLSEASREQLWQQHWPHGQGWGGKEWHRQGLEDAEQAHGIGTKGGDK